MKAESDRKFSEFLEAKVLSDRLEYSESLLKNRRKELIRRGLESLEVEPDDLFGLVTTGAPSSKAVFT